MESIVKKRGLEVGSLAELQQSTADPVILNLGIIGFVW